MRSRVRRPSIVDMTPIILDRHHKYFITFIKLFGVTHNPRESIPQKALPGDSHPAKRLTRGSSPRSSLIPEIWDHGRRKAENVSQLVQKSGKVLIRGEGVQGHVVEVEEVDANCRALVCVGVGADEGCSEECVVFVVLGLDVDVEVEGA